MKKIYNTNRPNSGVIFSFRRNVMLVIKVFRKSSAPLERDVIAVCLFYQHYAPTELTTRLLIQTSDPLQRIKLKVSDGTNRPNSGRFKKAGIYKSLLRSVLCRCINDYFRL